MSGGTQARLDDGRVVEAAGLGRRRVARLVDAVLLSPAMYCFVGYVVYVDTFGIAYLLQPRPESVDVSAWVAVLGCAAVERVGAAARLGAVGSPATRLA